LLHKFGYSHARDYRGGLADWVDSGGALEDVKTAVDDATAVVEDATAVVAVREPASDVDLTGPPLSVSPDGAVGRGPARVAPIRQLDRSVMGWIQRQSAVQLFAAWLGVIFVSASVYWITALLGGHGLVEDGSPIGRGLDALASSVYFSFTTATSVGYGDVIPLGAMRVVAVAEAVAALFIFGALIAKLVSHRQDQLVNEIHRVTFDERLDRVQTNLYLVISELGSLLAIGGDPHPLLPQLARRLDSIVVIFVGELRATHDLLYQPRLMVEEGVLSGILANLDSALGLLSELLMSLPAGFSRSPRLEISLENLSRLSADICGNCVPHGYTPRLIFWMNRIQTTASTIK
jgi:hypothetical protein